MPSGVAADSGASAVPVPAAATGGRMDRGVPLRLPARLLARLPALATAVPGVRRRGGGVAGGLGGTYDDDVGSAVSLSITDFALMGDLGIQNTNTTRARLNWVPRNNTDKNDLERPLKSSSMTTTGMDRLLA